MIRRQLFTSVTFPTCSIKKRNFHISFRITGKIKMEPLVAAIEHATDPISALPIKLTVSCRRHHRLKSTKGKIAHFF